ITVRSWYIHLDITQGGGRVLVSTLTLKAIGGPMATSSSSISVIQR
ncbi:hypothetical protein PanWU01x14_012060, partial [Parasponia andersonii]